MIGEGLTTVGRIVLGWVIMGWLVPGAILPRIPGSANGQRLARWVLAAAFWLVVTIGLALLKALSLPFLAISAAIGVVVVRRLAPGPPDGERSLRWLDGLGQPLNAGWGRFSERFHWPHRCSPRQVAALLIILGLATWLALQWFRASLQQITPGSPRGPMDLLAIQHLLIHDAPFHLGVYPLGTTAWAALIARGLVVDPMNSLRFLGPLAAVAGLVMVITVLAEWNPRPGAMVVGIAIWGLSRWPGLALPGWSPTAPLALHWGAVWIPVGLWASVSDGPPRARAFTVAAALTLTGLFDPALLPVALIAVALIGMGPILMGSPWRPWRVTMAGALGGTALAVTPLVLGHLAVSAPAPLLWYGVTQLPPSTIPPWAPLGLVGVGAVLSLLDLGWRLGPRPGLVLGLGLVTIAMGVMSTATHLGPWPGATLILFSGIPSFAVLAGAWTLLGRVPAAWRVAITGVGAAVAVAFASYGPIHLQRFQPTGSGRAYLAIAHRFTRYQWTMVSPVSGYPMVLSQGWHVELASFVRHLSMAQARNPAFRLNRSRTWSIPTPELFIFIDVRPGGKPLTRRDLRLPLAATAAGDYRARYLPALEARALAWMTAYQHSHPQQTQVFYRTPDLVVYRIDQASRGSTRQGGHSVGS